MDTVTTTELKYQSGFGNRFASEALANTLPHGQNSPQKVAHGLYAEGISGTAFTAPRAENRSTWFYRIRPSAKHPAFRQIDNGLLRTAPFDEVAPPPNQLRWDPLPLPEPKLSVEYENASYRIPGRSFQTEMKVTNNGKSPVRLGEFLTANLRFINPDVRKVVPLDSHDLVASNGLRVEGGPIPPGQARTIKMFAEDALWETYRLTTMINDPDSIVAGLLFFYDDKGGREIVEVGGPLLPVFE